VPGKDEEESYEPIVPMNVGNFGSPEDPLEGRGEQTDVPAEGNMTILGD
jgi:hypothetical protein